MRAPSLIVGRHYPYQVPDAPLGRFVSSVPWSAVPEGQGTFFPLILDPSEYATALWRVKSWRLTGTINFSSVRVFEDFTITYTSNDFQVDLVFDRAITEGQILSDLENDMSGTPFGQMDALPTAEQTFEGTCEIVETGFDTIVEPSTILVQGGFTWDAIRLVSPQGTIDSATRFFAVGKSQTEEGKVAAFLPFYLGLRATSEIGNVASVSLTCAQTDLAFPYVATAEPVGEVALFGLGYETVGLAPERRRAPLYIVDQGGGLGSFTPTVVLTDLGISPAEFFPYNNAANEPTYDTATGAFLTV